MNKFTPFFKWLLFLFFAVCFILYHQFAYLGHYGFDDLHYAELAANLLNGNWDWGDHYGYRWSVVGLTAISYLFFGINDLGSAMPALVLSISTLLLIFLILKKYSLQVVFLGLALFSFNNWGLFYSDKLMPDAYVAFFVFAAFVVYYLFLQKENNKPINFSILFVASLFGAFLAKGTVVLALPLFLIFFISDLIQKKNKKFWMYALGIGAGVGMLYFVILFAVTGDLFIRFKAIEGGSYLSFCSYNEQPLRVLFKRVVYELFYELSHQGMLVGLLLILPVLLYIKPKSYLKGKDTLLLFSFSAIVLVFLANFMTISFSAYSPMCTDSRHYLYIIPFLAVAAPLAINAYGSKWKYMFSVLGLIGATALVLYYFESTGMFKILATFAGGTILFFFLGKRFKIIYGLVFFVLGMVLILKPVESVKYANKVDYTAQKWFYQRNIIKSDVDVVVADEVSKRYLNYFAGFKAKGKKFISFQEAENNGIPANASAYLLKNSYTNYLCGAKGSELPFFVQYPGMVYDTLLMSRTQDIVLYDVQEWIKPTAYFHTKNGMEESVEGWSFDEWALDEEHALEGKHSNRAKEFSSTFSIDLSALDSIHTDMVIVEANVYANVPDETSASIIISIDNKEGTVFWEAFSFMPMIKSYGSWWPVQINKMLPKENLAPGNTLKVYVWNEKLEVVYLDNFEVKISGI